MHRSFCCRSVPTLLAVAWLIVATVSIANANELIVDNTDPSVRVSGPWIPTKLTAGFLGSDYLYRTSGAGDDSRAHGRAIYGVSRSSIRGKGIVSRT